MADELEFTWLGCKLAWLTPMLEMNKGNHFLDNTLPRLDPIIAVESDEHGWRGFTVDGEILEVSAARHKCQKAM